jgi:protein TonB
MFEDSFVVSQLSPVPAAKRWTRAGSAVVQLAIAAALATLPLLHPERLSLHLTTPVLVTPPLPKPAVQIVQQRNSASTTGLTPEPTQDTQSPPSMIRRDPGPAIDPPAPLISTGTGMFADNGLPGAVTNTGPGPTTELAVRPERPKRISISSGISMGMLLVPIRPIYPAIARAARVEGTVVVEAVISKTGKLESLHVVSGPEMLRNASLDAIRAAQYRPYLLNGEPTEVQTTFTVNFKIGS